MPFSAPRFFVFCSFFMLLQSCAREVTPNGGPSDKDAPKLNVAKSTPNLQRNYKKSEIVFQFDEWLQLKDVASQVFVSPPTTKKPQVKLEGKRVVVNFDENEALRANTTYTIHFGSSVQDLNEGNAVKDMRFVFSTGDEIDSLGLRGKVVDALAGTPFKNVSVALYREFNDSTATKSLPDYLAFTDDQGQYLIQNVAEGSYHLVAFKDDNKNNKWTSPLELVGFSDSLVNVTSSNSEAPPVALFKTDLPLRLVNKETQNWGQVKLVYGTDANGLDMRVLSDSVRWQAVRQRDSLLIWYDHSRTTEWSLVCGTDTVVVRPGNKTDFMTLHKVAWIGAPPVTKAKTKSNRVTEASPAPNAQPGLALPEQMATRSIKPILPFQYPVSSVDTSRIICIRTSDSTSMRDFAVTPDTLDPTRMYLRIPSNTTDAYRFTFLPSAVTDFWQVRNLDTLTTTVRTLADAETGNINLTITALVPGTQYVMDLKSGSQTIRTEIFLADAAQRSFLIEAVVPGPFTVNITQDKNANGRWDSGDFMKRRQPEPVFTQVLESVRPNWTVDAQMTLDAAAPKKKAKKF